MTIVSLLATGAVILGSAFFYLASPNQRWLASPWPAGPARGAALALLALGGFGLAQDMQAVTAVFVSLTLLMLGCAVLPYLGVLFASGRER
jgi:hypothetical protein